MNELHLTKRQTVKIFKPITLLFFLFSLSFSYAAVSPGVASPKPDFTRIKAKDIEKISGKKLTFLQKIGLKIFQKKLSKFNIGEMTEQQRKQAKASMFLGIGSLFLLLFSSALSAISLLCIPAAILAIIFGAKSLKGNSNAKGIVGIVTGGVTLVIIILAVLLIALLFASWG